MENMKLITLKFYSINHKYNNWKVKIRKWERREEGEWGERVSGPSGPRLKEVHRQTEVWSNRKFYFFTKQERRLIKELRQEAGREKSTLLLGHDNFQPLRKYRGALITHRNTQPARHLHRRKENNNNRKSGNLHVIYTVNKRERKSRRDVRNKTHRQNSTDSHRRKEVGDAIKYFRTTKWLHLIFHTSETITSFRFRCFQTEIKVFQHFNLNLNL